MNHRLNQKFLALVLIKGFLVGYAQWAGAITAPVRPSPPVRSSGDNRQTAAVGDSLNLCPARHPPILKSHPPRRRWQRKLDDG